MRSHAVTMSCAQGQLACIFSRVGQLIARPAGELVQPGDQAVAGPGAIAGDHSLRRNAGGRAAIAASSTARWSATVFDPADPLRSIPASGSLVLSQ